MAITALNQLQEQIEAVRREAYAAGYAAALESIREFVSKAGPASSVAGATAAVPASRGGRGARKEASEDAWEGAARRGTRRKGSTGERTEGGRRSRGQGRSARSGGTGSRPQRGNNAKMIEEVLQAIAPRAAKPAEIRTALKRDKGAEMAFTSIRHALGQLEARGAVEQAGDKMWRLRGQAAAS